MRSFRDYLKEDVTPAALVKDGSIDLERSVVRDQINSSLAAVTADPAVTPYIALNKISKVLSYFHIILPKRMYLEGDKGIEAVELRQFGEKMGMTDQGEFIKEVPGKYHLFVEYHRASPMNITYAVPTVGGMFKVTAKIVDKAELDRLIAGAERALAEDAACQQAMSKEKAPKEPIHDVDSEGSESTKKAVKTSNKKSLEESDVERLAAKRETESMAKIAKHAVAKGADIKKLPPGKKKLGEEQIDEVSKEKLDRYREKAFDVSKRAMYSGDKETERKRDKGREIAFDKLTGRAKVHAKEESQLDELHGKGSIQKIRQAHYKSANEIAQADEKRMKKNPSPSQRVNNPHADEEIRHHIGQVRRADRLQKKANVAAAKKGQEWVRKGLEEAGGFSYGAKKPRKGSLKADISKQRKEYDAKRPAIEPKDQMVGTAKLVKKESIEEMNREQGSILNRYISKTNPDYKTSKEVEKRKEGRALALKKKWGDKEFGLDEPKVKAVHRGKIDEVSKETLASYIPKAAHSAGLIAAKRASKVGRDISHMDTPEYAKSEKKQTMRHRGIQRAAEKLAKE